MTKLGEVRGIFISGPIKSFFLQRTVQMGRSLKSGCQIARSQLSC